MAPSDGQPEARTLATTTHGRFLVQVPTEAPPWPILVGFHGYGENAETHLSELRRVPGSAGWLVVSIQALHPFYTKAGSVVANWMTSQDRDLAILDNVAYVRQVLAQVRENYPTQAPLVFVGFSQGGAMAYRAAAHSACDGVVVLGADLPPDVAARQDQPLPRVLIGRGRDDPWYTAERHRADLAALARVDATVEICEFDGGHIWSDEFRQAVARVLSQARMAPRHS